jgi:hypothetical protein
VTPADWHGPLPAWLWQVALHSATTGFLLYAWARRVRLPSGHAKRRLLVILLVLPLVTAAVPGRGSAEFRDRLAWLDSGRVLAIPLGAGARVYHVVLLVGLATVAVTFWQEVWPALRRARTGPGQLPPPLGALVRGLPGWAACEIRSSPSESIVVATGGWPGRPCLIVSRGALSRLGTDELAVAIRHEHAHWQAGRWLRSHGLFVVRLLQCHNPVALWAFREYCLEVEIECDASAVAGRDPGVLARALLAIYESIHRGDVAARSALRKRTSVLLGDDPVDDGALPPATIAVAGVILAAVLPWLV